MKRTSARTTDLSDCTLRHVWGRDTAPVTLAGDGGEVYATAGESALDGAFRLQS